MVKKMTDDSIILEEELKQLVNKIIVNNINPFDAYVGHIIKTKRKRLHLSQQQVAYLLGVTFQQLQKYEKGTNKISTEKLLDLCYLMGIPHEVFLDGYNLFQKYFNAVAPEDKGKKLAANEIVKRPFYPSKEIIQQKLNEIKQAWEKEGNINPLELSSFFNRFTEEDFQKFYHADLEKVKNTSHTVASNTAVCLKEEEITKEMLQLYQKVYKNMTNHPLKDIFIETLE